MPATKCGCGAAMQPRWRPRFKAICSGEYDHLPESAFYMVGTIEEAVEKAQKMAAEAA